MRPKVHILTTGGTISQRSKVDGVAAMGFNPQELAAELGFADIDLEFRAVIHKGSKDVVPDDWKTIAAATAAAIAEGSRGVVILHGTDTMHYTAAALSFMLEDLGVPVVLTGSMIPGGDAGSDSLPNLRDAIGVAALADLAEVCIVFSADVERTTGMIIRGCRARKIHSHAINAFGSINAPPLGTIDAATIHVDQDAKSRSSSKLTLNDALDQNVILVKLTPAVTPRTLTRLLQGISGAVFEGTGIGHVKSDLYKVIESFNKPVAISTQAIYGGERLGLYESDQYLLEIPNIVPVGDMSSDTALVKLMWALARTGDVKSLMQTNIAGEVSERSLKSRTW
jgi:glutamyl-tRNA(Gln) amidotransferase subunit D